MEGSEWVNQGELSMSNTENMSVYYHYTSLSAFYNIIKSGRLKMFDVNRSNDPKEGMFALESLWKLLDDINCHERVGLNSKEWIEMRKGFVSFVGEPKRMEPNFCVFSTSLCIENPMQKVPMWQIYGDNGKGVAIGFNTKIVSDNNLSEPQEITYLTQEDMDKKAQEFINMNKNKNKNKNSDEICEAIREFYFKSFLWKRICFQYEKEYRLLSEKYDLNPSIFRKPVGHDVEAFWVNDTIKLCKNVKIDNENYGCITEVVLGPRCLVSEREMEAILSICCKRRVNIRTAER